MWEYKYKKDLIDKKDPVLKELIEICDPVFANTVLTFNTGSIECCGDFLVRLVIYRGDKNNRTDLYRFDIFPEDRDGTDPQGLTDIHLCMSIKKRIMTPLADEDNGKITGFGDYKIGFTAWYRDKRSEIPSMDGIVTHFSAEQLRKNVTERLENALATSCFFRGR